MFSQFQHKGTVYESISLIDKPLYSSHKENLFTNEYKIGFLQARFSVLSTIVLPCDETRIICLN